MPHRQALALDRELTARLVQRCGSESTSVHAAFCAAAPVAFHRRGREFVRVLAPVDLRRATGLPDEVVNRFVGELTHDPVTWLVGGTAAVLAGACAEPGEGASRA